MTSHYLFEAEFCNPASGWEKGQIEKNVQDARHRLWQTMPPFESLKRPCDTMARIDVRDRLAGSRSTAHPRHNHIRFNQGRDQNGRAKRTMPSTEMPSALRMAIEQRGF
jgi:hypothetical protein